MGGLFELSVLFQEPELFNRYIIGSPPLDPESEILAQENAYARKNQSLKSKVFLHTGEYEPLQYFNEFISQLKSRNYKGLELESMVIEHMGHVSEVPYGVGRGLQFVFAEQDVSVDILLLDAYTGHYKSGDENISITRISNNLYLLGSMGQLKLYAKTNELFYAKGMGGNTIQFNKDQKSIVTGYTLMIGDHSIPFKKMD